ncbi:MAG TPA: hypothetical protein VF308_03390 [Caldimonas sp.]
MTWTCGKWWWLAWLLAATGARADAAPSMHAVQVSAHAWTVQGASALGSRENDNFISNAGFIVTPAAWSSSTRSARRLWRDACSPRSRASPRSR